MFKVNRSYRMVDLNFVLTELKIRFEETLFIVYTGLHSTN